MHAHLCCPADEATRDALALGSSAHCRLDPLDGGPGLLLTLWPDDGAMLVAALAEDEQALATTQDVITSTPLLPGEDVALLRGPDRHGEHRVRDGGVVALITAAAPVGVAR